MGNLCSCHEVNNISDEYTVPPDFAPLKALPPHMLSPMDALKAKITPNHLAGSKSATPVIVSDENTAAQNQQISSFFSPGNPFRQRQFTTPPSFSPAEFVSPGLRPSEGFSPSVFGL